MLSLCVWVNADHYNHTCNPAQVCLVPNLALYLFRSFLGAPSVGIPTACNHLSGLIRHFPGWSDGVHCSLWCGTVTSGQKQQCSRATRASLWPRQWQKVQLLLLLLPHYTLLQNLRRGGQGARSARERCCGNGRSALWCLWDGATLFIELLNWAQKVQGFRHKRWTS